MTAMHAFRLTFRAAVEPFRQLAFWLMLEPHPSDLDHDRAREAVRTDGFLPFSYVQSSPEPPFERSL